MVELPPELWAAEDAAVLAAAAQDGRVLVTSDTDFGTLVYLYRQASPPAMILIRLRPAELATRLQAVAAVMEQATVSPRVFVVTDHQGYRVRSLP